MLGVRDEDLPRYHLFFTFKRPWTFSYVWYCHSGIKRYHKHAFHFYGYQEDNLPVTRDDPIIVKNTDIDLDVFQQLNIFDQVQLDIPSRENITEGDILFFINDILIARYYMQNDVLVARDITHYFNIGGLKILDWIFEELERLDREGVIKLHRGLMLTNTLTANRVLGVYLFDGETLWRFGSDLSVRRVSEVKSFNEVVNVLANAVFREKEIKINDLYESVVYRVYDAINSMQEEEPLTPLLRILLKKRYPVYLWGGKIFVIHPLIYKPKYVLRDDRAYRIPESFYEKHPEIPFEGYIGFLLHPVETKTYVDRIVIFDRALNIYTNKLPHYSIVVYDDYSIDGGVCVGAADVKTIYERLPGFEIFYNRTIRPTIVALETINLDSAYDSDQTILFEELYNRLEERGGRGEVWGESVEVWESGD